MLRPHSTLFHVGHHPYVVSGIPQAIKLAQHTQWCGVTVIHIATKEIVSLEYVKSILQIYASQDDVFSSEFLQGVIFTSSLTKKKVQQWIESAAIGHLQSLGNKWVELLDESRSQDWPSPGIFIAINESLYEVFKLYPDANLAFVEALIEGAPGTYSSLGLTTQTPEIKFVAVPTRIHDSTRNPGALAGWRIAVKDNFHISGIRTSLCNRAYFATYPPQKETAVCISKLLDAGARLVGTTRMAAFAATEEPIECVDYGAPWNPRADGYQSPAGSSSGSGAAVASYEWLDIAIGTDTSGSGRRPAHWNGCFGLRPTHGVLDKTGLIPSFPQFDMPTLFGRDIYQCQKFVKAWYGDSLPRSTTKLPAKLVVLLDYMRLIVNPDQRDLIDKLVADLERSLGIRHERISFEQEWDRNPPTEANGQKYADYMKTAGRDSFFYDDYHNTDSFRNEYKKSFGKMPYISPPVRWQWDLSATITQFERNEAVHRLSVYKEWFNVKIMEEGFRRTFVIIPIENISPRYRDDATTHFNPVGVPMLFLSPILGGPECTIPIGQVPYVSKVSGREEFLPVGISLLASPKTDLDLLDTVARCLEVSKRPTKVQVGREMF